ncbi:protoporphyrinogen IX oxidase [Pedobacter changchengzhani]|uniref:Protoporphyrinogen IX oxidase n=1 Tax=Pedobacter changchengzhani TaxID=2529274 RepID=A0A4R5MK36_9SPHI|nr:CopD family protein [Pedobacter changchengzhani]TDG35449.1 protoporphyrinogen IX oxidase [Pedobacter changchengzhani]
MIEILLPYYAYFKAVHIVFVISWMAGLFYILSLFIYHTEANDKPEPEKSILQQQFIKMEATLWKIIATPAMVISLLAGICMLDLNRALLQMDWMWVKLSFVVGLLIYHFICQKIVKQLKNGQFKMTSFQLRLWRELATIFMIAIVFVVILKNALNWVYGLVGIMGVALVIMIAVKMYKSYRLRK